MKNYTWIEKIDAEQYVTPIIIQNDCEYLPELKKTLNSFIVDLKCSGIDNTIENEIESYYPLSPRVDSLIDFQCTSNYLKISLFALLLFLF